MLNVLPLLLAWELGLNQEAWGFSKLELREFARVEGRKAEQDLGELV